MSRARPMDQRARAMRAAGRLLASRARSKQELRDALVSRSFDPGVADDVVARLGHLGLVDDVAFARSWVEERSLRGGLAPRRAVEELVARGVERGVAEEVAERGADEDVQAAEVAGRLLKRVAGLPLPRQTSRLTAMLLRRGFEPEAAAAGVRAVLPPEDWD